MVSRSMRLATALVLACSTLGAAPTMARAASRTELARRLRAARTAFDRGTALLHKAPDEALAAFREARDQFQSVVDAGIRNDKLYYNLANTHMRLGELGPAIADYRRAERLRSGWFGFSDDGQLEANLRFARSLRRDRIESSAKGTLMRTLFVWHYALPLRARMMGALTAWSLFWLLMIVPVVMPRVRLPYLRGSLLIVWFALGVSVAVDWPTHGRPSEGVLVRNEVIVRKGDGEGYDRQFKEPLHEGVEFTVLDIRGGWVHIELPDGNRGWIRRRDAVLF